MKIESGRPVGATGGARKGDAKAAAPGFSLTLDAPQRAAPVPQTGQITALDAIIALQSDETPARRRGRQARRGRDALDALECLEEALLVGRAPHALRVDLERLARNAEPTGDPGLDETLREIDIRVAVELAKLERLGRA